MGPESAHAEELPPGDLRHGQIKKGTSRSKDSSRKWEKLCHNLCPLMLLLKMGLVGVSKHCLSVVENKNTFCDFAARWGEGIGGKTQHKNMH